MRNFAQCMIVAVCALTSTVNALDAIQNVQTLTDLAQNGPMVITGTDRTDREYQPCWSNKADPPCRENQYLDRSGLIDQTAPQEYDELTNAGNCVCRALPLDCEEGFIWDYQNEKCQCVQVIGCPDDYYFDYNSCGCICQNRPNSDCTEEQYWSNTHCECRCKPKHAADFAGIITEHTAVEWNSDKCDFDIVEDLNNPCSTLDDGLNSYYFSVLDAGCVFKGVVCPTNQYYDGDLGYCICETQACGPNEYFDNNAQTANGEDACYCRCIPQVCPNNYVFNNDQCECDCLEPEGTCVDTEIYHSFWSTEECQCQCYPKGEKQDGKFWDTSKCAWSCEPSPCPADKPDSQWDFDTCECRCCPSSLCGPDQFYNTLSCECEQINQACATDHFWYVDEETGQGNCVRTPTPCDEDKYWSFELNGCAFIEIPCDADQFFNGLNGNCEFTEPDPSTAGDHEIWDTVTGQYVAKPYPCADMMEYYDVAVDGCVCRPQVCGNDQIFDYEECRCRCKPEQCPDGFRWSENLCDCVCAQPTEGCGADKFWADNLCQCVCEEPEGVDCASQNKYWSHEYCDCLCGPTDATVPDGQYWNTDSCQFECVVQVCEAGEYFRIDTEDPDNCACECLPHECAEGEFWNTDTCCCDCLEGDCREFQVWDVATCGCVCLNEADADETCQEGQYWDTTDCECKCKDNGTCLEHQYFNYDNCSCECAYPSPQAVAENEGKWFSIEVCDWVKAPLCQDEWPQKYWDPTDDTCKCFDQPCPAPYDWNSTTCACECNIVDGSASGDKTDCDDQPAYFWNVDRCECQLCEREVCPQLQKDGGLREQFWNAQCCECQCIPWKDCGEQKWDFDNCDCAL